MFLAVVDCYVFCSVDCYVFRFMCLIYIGCTLVCFIVLLLLIIDFGYVVVPNRNCEVSIFWYCWLHQCGCTYEIPHIMICTAMNEDWKQEQWQWPQWHGDSECTTEAAANQTPLPAQLYRKITKQTKWNCCYFGECVECRQSYRHTKVILVAWHIDQKIRNARVRKICPSAQGSSYLWLANQYQFLP